MNGLCSHERLELALAGKLNSDDEARLHLHLDDCELCAAEMERLSGGEQASREIAAMLMPDDLDDALPLREECSTADFVVDHLEPSDDPAVLGRLGGYDVLDIIGRGGMGVVLKGFDRELKRFVAIKALAPHLAHSALARKRFAREAQAAAAVVNLHVIAIHQVQPNGQLPFLVMPLLTGESLAQRLKARGTLELKEILRIGMQAAEGLAAAHGQGLIHRDVKPANILLEKGVERAVLTDFGLARAADDVSMTRWGIIAGTPEYMSPEQARGEALDGRSDLFSLGCVLYEMATGVSPFRTDSTMATLRRIVDEQPAAMASLVPELPPWFSHIVERLLSKDPAQRFASASEVSQLLEQCLSHLQQPMSVPLPAPLVPHATGRRSIFNLPRKGVLAMLGTVGMTLLGMVLWQATEAPDIAGEWTGEGWGRVVLKQTDDGKLQGTFSETVGKESGAIQLKWSRLERRFNGTWKDGDDRFGELSIRLVGDEIRGAHRTDAKSKADPSTPRLAELVWSRDRQSPLAEQGNERRAVPPQKFRAIGKALIDERTAKPVGPKPVIGHHPDLPKGTGHQSVMSWSSDSKRLFTQGIDNRLVRWERSGEELKSATSVIPDGGDNGWYAHAYSIAVSNKSGLVVLGTNVGTVQFWDGDSVTFQKQFLVEPGNKLRGTTDAVAISPDEKLLAEYGVRAHLYEIATMKRLCEFGKREWNRTSSLAFAPDGRMLAALDFKGEMTLWSVPDGALIAEWSLKDVWESSTLQWSRDGDLIAVVSDGHIAFVTPTVGSAPRIVVAPDEVFVMAWKNQEDANGISRRIGQQDGIAFAGVTALAPDFKTVASVKIDSSVSLWDVETRSVTSNLAPPPNVLNDEHPGLSLKKLMFSPNGKRLACQGVEGSVIVWTLNDAGNTNIEGAWKPATAKLPDGRSVELVGITKNTRPAKEGWRPDGSKLSDVSEWPEGMIDENARDLLLEFRGLRGKPSLWLEPAGKWRRSLDENPYRLRYTISSPDPFASDEDWLALNELRVALTDEPWGPWQRISVAGELLNQLGEKDLYRSSYSQIELQRVEPSQGKVKRMLLVLRQPKQHSRLFDFEIFAFDTDGQEHKVQERQSRSIENTDLEESVWSVLDSFPYDKQLARFEYRLRPYRHWVTFENVSLQPGKQTDVKIKVELLPTEPTRLRVRNSDGSQTLFNSVVEAKVGYPNSQLPNWCEYPTREGIVSLEKLPVGTHWLVAAAEFSNRLPFQITIPTEQPLVERRLRAVNWSSSTPKFEIGRQPVVELHDKEGEVIVVEILNQSTDPLSVSEFDLELLSEFENETIRQREPIRGLSPKWLMADREPFPRIKIEAGQTGRTRLNWREWVRKGLWSSRNHEEMAEPGFPPNEPGKVWVKAKLGTGVSLPVAVTDPKIMLAEESRRRDDDLKRLRGAWRLDSEEQWGAVRAAYDARTQLNPLLIKFENDTVCGAFGEPWKPLRWQMEFLEDTPLPSMRLVATASDGTRKTQLLSYRFQNGVLELCYERGSSDRIPNEFNTSEGAKTIIWRLVRATEAEKGAAVNETDSQTAVRPPTAASWTSFRHDLAHSGVATSALPDKLALLWEVKLGDQVLGTPAIVGEHVYVPCMSGSLFCLDRKSGQKLWNYRSLIAAKPGSFKPGFMSSPTVTADAIYLGDQEGVFHAIDRATGKPRWEFVADKEILGSAAVFGGKVLFGSYDKHLYCLDEKDGALVWKFATEGFIHTTPAVVDGHVLIAGCDNYLRILDLATGAEKLAIALAGELIASPAIVGDVAFVGTFGGDVNAVNWKTSEIVWRYTPEKRASSFHSSPAVTDKMVVLGGIDKHVHAIDRTTGMGLWTFATQGKVDSSPAVVGQRVFIGSHDGHLYELDAASGAMRWKFDLGKLGSASPAIGEGVLVIGSADSSGKVVCFGALQSTPAKTSNVPLESDNATIFQTKLESPPSELASRRILRDTYHLDLPEAPGADARDKLELFDFPPAAWEHVGRLTGIREIESVAGDLRGEPLRQIARIRSLKKLRIINAKLLPVELTALAEHPSLESLDAMLTTLDELANEPARDQLVGQFTTERAWIDDVRARLFAKTLVDGPERRALEGAVLTDRVMPSLATLKQLKSLRLINTHVSRHGLAALQKLPALRSINLSVLDQSAELGRVVASFPALESFGKIGGYPELIAELAHAPKLKELDTASISDECVSELLKIKGLTRLNLWSNTLSDDGLVKLAELPQLARVELDASQGKLTKSGVAKFRSLKPNCEVHGDDKLPAEPSTTSRLD